MKKLMTMAAILALTAGAAYAVEGGASQDIELNADVGGFCTVDNESESAITQTIPTDSSGNVVDENILVEIGDVICNGPTDVQLSSAKGGVFSTATAPDGFQNYISYVASVTDPTAASVTADAITATPTAGTVVTTGGATSDTAVVVTINPTPNDDPLIAASDYSDTLTVSITPDS